MPKEIITISRQYGSGGREIGERVADLLGYAYYDRELIRRMAQLGDVDIDLVRVGGEGLMGKVSSILMHRGSEGKDEDSLPLPDRLFLMQSRCIKQIASEGPCVIIGHNADYVLQGFENVFSVFIHADWQTRTQRVMLRNNLSRAEAEKRIKKTDHNRASFYEQYTERRWGKAENYDLSCSSSYFGIEQLARIIVQIVQMN